MDSFLEILGDDFPFFSTIVLLKNRIHFPWGSGGLLERRIPRKNGEDTPRGVRLNQGCGK